ncbi:MAG: DsbA family protein, partial [Gammaproteobacteria bacterium]
MPAAMRSTIQETWRRIQQVVPGTEFNFDFWTRCVPRRSTYPACRAVIAAQRQGASYEESMILAIQEAYYREARNPSDDETLLDLATRSGFDAERFQSDLNSAETQSLLREQIRMSRKLGADGLPSLTLEYNGLYRRLPYNYRDAGVIRKVSVDVNGPLTDLLLLDFLAPCADYAGVGWVPMRRLRLVWRMADRA